MTKAHPHGRRSIWRCECQWNHCSLRAHGDFGAWSLKIDQGLDQPKKCPFGLIPNWILTHPHDNYKEDLNDE